MRIRQSVVAMALTVALVPGGEFSALLVAQSGSRGDDTGGVKPPLHAATAASAATSVDDLDTSRSELRPLIERFSDDRASLVRTYPLRLSATRSARLKQLYTAWRERIGAMAFDTMSAEGRVDYVLFKNYLDYELLQLDIEAKRYEEMKALIPFAETIIRLDETRRRMEPVNSRSAADTLNQLKKLVAETQKRVEAGLPGSPRGGPRAEPAAQAESKPEAKPDAQPSKEKEKEPRVEPIKVKKTVANRAVDAVGSLRNTLRGWFNFYNEYDPVFTWWVDAPYKELDETLTDYANFIREKVLGLRRQAARSGPQREGAGGPGGRPGHAGPGGPTPEADARAGDASDIIGDPIGHDALMLELAHEMIPYTPEELIAIAQKELAWCEAEMLKASRELGYGDDWHKALEHVKGLHVEPGQQPQMIRELALEATQYVEENNLLTVPPLAKEDWGMQMMSPERQLINPFFTGGADISVSYPTAGMSHEQKLMSMRGNNRHFSRATVHHELIPGHHLQGFMTARYKPYRGLFSTPFWGEGWALYWELLLWDLGFAKTPENRIGMLFWRMHRCARIIFSLSFHLEKMTPQECIDFLVERVGHERENATAEVRRSFETNYSPLYQAAYLLGGIQLRSLHRELVESGKMTNRAFHDAVLRENRMPIEMVRAILTQQPPPREFKSNWKFYGPITGR